MTSSHRDATFRGLLVGQWLGSVLTAGGAGPVPVRELRSHKQQGVAKKRRESNTTLIEIARGGV